MCRVSGRYSCDCMRGFVYNQEKCLSDRTDLCSNHRDCTDNSNCQFSRSIITKLYQHVSAFLNHDFNYIAVGCFQCCKVSFV